MALRGKRWWILGTSLVVVALVATFALLYGGTQNRGPTGNPGATDTAVASPTASTAETPTQRPSQAPASNTPSGAAASATLAAMSLEQKVGQVLMVSSPVTGADADSRYAVETLYVGNVFMKGRSTAGQAGIAAQVADIAGHISGERTAGARPFVATDQEGGLVQIMRGPGFADMPQAIEQGQLPAADLLAEATTWGQQLAAVGVNVNLAPVMDTVPSAAFAPQNAPIGAFGREFGYTPDLVASHGVAFAQGMAAAGVQATVKHFPGLGRVTLNTDVSAGVSDDITVRNDAYIEPFRAAVNAGVPWLMVSNALYPKIDAANLAPFSSVIVTDMVRGDLGFAGIIVSDDICDAVQVSAVPVAQRGVDFLAAGGTMALCTNQSLLPQMYAGLLTAAQGDPAFAAKVDAAALVVLTAKADKGLLN
ncbi:glycoside hydrolase family 3 N-terminal domain-containing protein [Arthrobacter glacialis]|uniref:beta-N-acetylhexosaminidase n=1 Tax=Arthrobacter glacialis TaxID=1664 RepID=A0A2S4A078_ARTGL|nr:glycoside hydrolase family 3 N-terminal domain-containing protein [Arthrobacter glacialis]POH74572.1 beta-N-acetylhexosaminidase [Arthrobacter glacialis]